MSVYSYMFVSKILKGDLQRQKLLQDPLFWNMQRTIKQTLLLNPYVL